MMKFQLIQSLPNLKEEKMKIFLNKKIAFQMFQNLKTEESSSTLKKEFGLTKS